MSAIYWARLERFFFGASRDDAARAAFDDALILEQLILPPGERLISGRPVSLAEQSEPFKEWASWPGKISY